MIVAVLAILAGGFALTSFFAPDITSSETPSAVGFRRITADELKPQFDRGDVTIIDVREADQVLQSHIPGAPLAPIAGAAALQGGLAAWRKAGYPVESGLSRR